MHRQRFGDVRADAHHRVERRHRLLEHEPDAGAADRAHLLFGQRQQILALEEHLAADTWPGSCTSRMIENAVTDLPLPDSPTRPSVSPLWISNDTSFTATTGAGLASNTVRKFST